MTLTLPYPPSTNTAYAVRNGRKVKTTKARAYAEEVMWRVADEVRVDAAFEQTDAVLREAVGDDRAYELMEPIASLVEYLMYALGDAVATLEAR